jgi:hypothetical protein
MANLNEAELLHAVFALCGIPGPATRALIMAHKGFTLEDLGILETNMNITEMAKRSASRTQAEGQMLLETVAIKRLCVTWNCHY